MPTSASRQAPVRPDLPSTLLPSLTGLRAVAAVAVFVSHLGPVLPPVLSDEAADPTRIPSRVLSLGASGVSLFFVLSGFVLAWTHSDSTPVPAYILRRLARVWPVHVVVWAAFVVSGVAGYGEPLTFVSSVAALLLVQCWVPGLGFANAVNPVAWTLSVELFFYLVFPAVIGPVRRLDRRGLSVAAAGCVAVGGVITIAYLEPRGITVSTFPPFRLWEFALGMIAGTALRSRKVVAVPPLFIGLALLAAGLVLQTWVSELRGPGIVLVAVAYLLIICSLTVADLARREHGWLRSRAAQRAGAWSYAFYLVQLLPLVLLEAFDIRPADGLESVLLLTAWFAITLGFASLIHVGIEMPAVRAVRSREMRRIRPSQRARR